MTKNADRQDEDEDNEKAAVEERPVFNLNFFVPAHPVLMICKL